MKCIIGLGNPGLKYKYTRHNLGFLAIDLIAGKYNVKLKRRLCLSLVGNFIINEEKILLAKPFTYMNLSGNAFTCLQKKFKLNLKDILVICDDIYLNVGVIKLKSSGGSGGHKGLESIILAIGREDFPRLRIGAGPPDGDQTDFVLRRLTEEELEKFNSILEKVREAVETWINQDIEKAMSLYNLKNINF